MAGGKTRQVPQTASRPSAWHERFLFSTPTGNPHSVLPMLSHSLFLSKTRKALSILLLNTFPPPHLHIQKKKPHNNSLHNYTCRKRTALLPKIPLSLKSVPAPAKNAKHRLPHNKQANTMLFLLMKTKKCQKSLRSLPPIMDTHGEHTRSPLHSHSGPKTA